MKSPEKHSTPHPDIIKEIAARLQKGEHLWRLLDQYDLTTDEKLELLKLFDDQKWD